MSAHHSRAAGGLFRALALAGIVCCAQAPAAAEPLGPAGIPAAVEAAVQQALSAMRQRIAPAAIPTLDALQAISFRGRPSIEVKGRLASTGGPGPVNDFTIYDLGTARIAVFVYFPNSSARKAGEPIISLSEIATGADAQLRSILPGANLVLEGIQRYRASGQESVYYEARYAPQAGDIPFLQPPVRILLDASTGRLFRFDLDPEWLAPPATPAARLSRQAAERIAGVALASRDLSPAFGEGARPGKIFAAELFYVRPNDWLGFHDPTQRPATRVAWVVPFTVAGEASGGAHTLFVDASNGHVLGGAPGEAATGAVR